MSSKEDTPGLAFQEKSLWISTVANVVIYAVYFARALAIGDSDPARVGALFGQAVILLVVVMVAGNVILAVHRRPERADERDRRIAVLAARNAYYVLATGAWLALCVTALSLGAFWAAHAVLFALVVAEVTKSASQLVYYRRGV